MQRIVFGCSKVVIVKTNESKTSPAPGLKKVGSGNTLLTDAEYRCFFVARTFQRKHLVRTLIPREIKRWRKGLRTLGWSRNPFIFIVQFLVICFAAIPMSLWVILKGIGLLLVFPFRYIGSFITPKSLQAPGEKTLVGIHNAFSKYIQLGTIDTIACLKEWIEILYGDRASQHHEVKTWMEQETIKLKQQNSDELTPAMRSLVAVSREKLSKQLGHYGKTSKSTP